MLITVLALAVQVQQPQQQNLPQSAVARVSVTPGAPSMVAGDTLRLRAAALDAQGRPVPGARILYTAAGAAFEAHVDSTGLVTSGAVGELPVVVTAIVPGSRPVLQRLTVHMLPGPAARIELSATPRRLVAGQRIRVDATAYSAASDRRADRIVWSSSAPAVAEVRNGAIVAAAPGKATITARAGSATRALAVEVLPASAVASFEVRPATSEARTGDVVRLTAVARDRAGKAIDGLTPTWMFTSGSGQLDQDGSFVAYTPGAYQLSASLGARSADAVVAVSPRDVRRRATVVSRIPRKTFMTSEVWVHPSGKVAYLGTHMGGDRVYAIDVANPAEPKIVDSIVVNARVINDMMTTPDGDYMVITREGAADRKNGIVIADTRDPLHPKAISEFTDGVTAGVHSAFIHRQAKYGTHIYLTNDGTGALHVIDINDPAKPKEVAQYRPRANGPVMLHDIDVQDGMLYGSWWNDGLVILDVGNGIKGGRPDHPVLVAQYKYDLEAMYADVASEGGPGYIRGTHTAWRHGKYVFIADEVFGNDAAQALFSHGVARAHGRLQVLDVTDIEHPKAVAWYEPEYGGVHNVWVAGDTLYMGAYNAGFHAFDISGELRGDLKAQGREIASVAPTSPDGWLPNATMTWGVVVKNNLAFVNDANAGLWIVRLEPKGQAVP